MEESHLFFHYYYYFEDPGIFSATQIGIFRRKWREKSIHDSYVVTLVIQSVKLKRKMPNIRHNALFASLTACFYFARCAATERMGGKIGS